MWYDETFDTSRACLRDINALGVLAYVITGRDPRSKENLENVAWINIACCWQPRGRNMTVRSSSLLAFKSWRYRQQENSFLSFLRWFFVSSFLIIQILYHFRVEWLVRYREYIEPTRGDRRWKNAKKSIVVDIDNGGREGGCGRWRITQRAERHQEATQHQSWQQSGLLFAVSADLLSSTTNDICYFWSVDNRLTTRKQHQRWWQQSSVFRHCTPKVFHFGDFFFRRSLSMNQLTFVLDGWLIRLVDVTTGRWQQ